jgi:hypothetical protein
MWLAVARVADFDYISIILGDGLAGQNLYTMQSSDGSTADGSSCYQLNSNANEEDCLQTVTVSGSGDDDDSYSDDVLYTVLAFSLINFIAIVVFGVMQASKSAAKPMTATSSNL